MGIAFITGAVLATPHARAQDEPSSEDPGWFASAVNEIVDLHGISEIEHGHGHSETVFMGESAEDLANLIDGAAAVGGVALPPVGVAYEAYVHAMREFIQDFGGFSVHQAWWTAELPWITPPPEDYR